MKTSDGRNFAHEGMGKSWQGHIDRNPGAALKPSGVGGKTDTHDSESENVVAEHGPAHTSHIMKDEKSGSYSVHSHHEDGHVHKSHSHATAGDAHEHSLKMHGGDMGEEEHDDMGEHGADDKQEDEIEAGKY